jgi:hypothetical protein
VKLDRVGEQIHKDCFHQYCVARHYWERVENPLDLLIWRAELQFLDDFGATEFKSVSRMWSP